MPGSYPPADYWERPEVVERFAHREPDHRLRALAREYARPAATPVLDVGCAGGRNTVFLAEEGFDVQAVDASAAMVEATRVRLASLLGAAEARHRVRLARMDDLGSFADGSFDLVVSLGVLHQARSWAEWRAAAAETARVLTSGGRLLVSQFTPATDLTGEGLTPVAGEAHLYGGLGHGPGILLRPDELDAGMREAGLGPEVPTTVGETILERGRRVSANGLYRKE